MLENSDNYEDADPDIPQNTDAVSLACWLPRWRMGELASARLELREWGYAGMVLLQFL